MRTSHVERDWDGQTVKLMINGDGVKVALAIAPLGPTWKRSEMALTQGKPVAPEYGFPGPDLSSVNFTYTHRTGRGCIPVVVVQIVGVLVVQPLTLCETGQTGPCG